MKKNIKNKSQEGVTLIEVLISVAIVSFVIVSIYTALSGTVRVASDSKQQIGAIALANEKMEIMRSLPYDDVGTIEGIISGSMTAQEEINKNGFNYLVKIDVRYIDDSFDGLFPDDAINVDYKQAQIEVTWQNGGSDRTVTFFSNFVPNGMETAVEGGILSVNTLTSGGDLVPNVLIGIESLDDNPAINYETSTDDQGNLILPGVPSQNYRLYAFKEGYENIQTYPNPPEASFTPIEKDLYISEDSVNSFTFIIEKTADLKLIASNVEDGSSVEGVDFEISGGRKIGISPDTFNFNEAESTNSEGELNYVDLSPGSYEIINYETLNSDDFQFVGSDADSSFELLASEEKEINFIFADKDTDSLFVRVIDAETFEPIAGTTVHLTGVDFDQSLTTGDNGSVYFPTKTDPETVMEADDYNLSISVDGYSDYDGIVSINNLVVKEIELNSL